MAVYTGMFKVYSCRAISANYNLQLPEQFSACFPVNKSKTYFIIPPVRTRSNLLAFLQVVSSAQEVFAQIRKAIWSSVV